MQKTLLVYYSQAVGNTKTIAEKIHAALGCDIARINTEVPYTGSDRAPKVGVNTVLIDR
jgi:flavodoxin